MPAPSDPEYDEVHFSKPRWFVDRMKAEYGDAHSEIARPRRAGVGLRTHPRQQAFELGRRGEKTF